MLMREEPGGRPDAGDRFDADEKQSGLKQVGGAELVGGRQQSGLHGTHRAGLQTHLQRQSTGKLFPLAIKGALVVTRQVGHMICQAPQDHLCHSSVSMHALASRHQVLARCNKCLAAHNTSTCLCTG